MWVERALSRAVDTNYLRYDGYVLFTNEREDYSCLYFLNILMIFQREYNRVLAPTHVVDWTKSIKSIHIEPNLVNSINSIRSIRSIRSTRSIRSSEAVVIVVAAVLIISQYQFERFSSSTGPYTQIHGSQMVKQWLEASLPVHWWTRCTSTVSSGSIEVDLCWNASVAYLKNHLLAQYYSTEALCVPYSKLLKAAAASSNITNMYIKQIAYSSA